MGSMDEPIRISYHPEITAPTIARFHACNALIRGIRGPVGSAKSVGCCFELFELGMLQHPYRGVRKVRSGILRNTYGELKTTTIQTWMDWFGPWTTIVYDAPIRGLLRLTLPDGTLYEHELVFVSADRPKDIKKLKSLELTFAWMNEASEMAKAVFDMLIARIWRYPSMRTGLGPTFSCLIMDTNAPSTDHWYYKLAEERDEALIAELEATIAAALREAGITMRYPLMEFFAQPPAIREDKNRKGRYLPNPGAENVKHHKLGYAYWLNQVAGKSKEWIKVYLMGLYGSIATGRVCYPEYDDEIHCAKEELEPVHGVPLLLGWDFGLTPACSISQITPRGQLLVLDEIIGTSIGVRTFSRDVVFPFLKENYKGFAVQSWADPSGNSRDQNIESKSIQEVCDAGIYTKPAWTNEFLTRKEAVAGFLTRLIAGVGPAFQLSPRCRTLRTGFISGYQVERLNVLATSEEEERFKDHPIKNMYSHIHEALQYSVMDFDAQFERDRRRLAAAKSGRVRRESRGPADTAGY